MAQLMLLDVGYKNFINAKQINYIIEPYTTRAKWLRKEAQVGCFLVDCTQGRKTNTIIVLKTEHVILSALKYNTVLKRFNLLLDNKSIKHSDPEELNAELLKVLENKESI